MAGAQKARRWAARIGSIVVGAVMLVLLGLAVLLVLVPKVTGGMALTVLSGSMEPGIMPGDIVVTRGISSENIDQLRIGDIITFLPYPDDPMLVTHRIVGQSAGPNGITFATQGDNNPSPDIWEQVGVKQIRGELLFVVPKLGFVKQWLGGSVDWLLPVAAVVLIGYGVVTLLLSFRRRAPVARESADLASKPVAPADMNVGNGPAPTADTCIADKSASAASLTVLAAAPSTVLSAATSKSPKRSPQRAIGRHAPAVLDPMRGLPPRADIAPVVTTRVSREPNPVIGPQALAAFEPGQAGADQAASLAAAGQAEQLDACGQESVGSPDSARQTPVEPRVAEPSIAGLMPTAIKGRQYGHTAGGSAPRSVASSGIVRSTHPLLDRLRADSRVGQVAVPRRAKTSDDDGGRQ
ncbi:MAG: signal peptidase I [Propionibacteriaceae bacterium]|jgi:signal peptidase|nr:signal peptidase I [Propionibacteriaceae bacterium]